MATGQVYSSTTAPNPKESCFMVPSKLLDKVRFGIKVCEVLLSFVAFILEEVVSSCLSCSPLYFFEFVSCTAFLFTLLLLILLATPLHTRVGISCWSTVDLAYTGGISVLFLVASIVFGSNHGGTTVERAAVAFGVLASILFVVDVALLVKQTRGLPFLQREKAEASNGGPVAAAVATPAEEEKLNQPAE